MRIQLDYTTYHIDLEKVMLHIKSWYIVNNEKMSVMQLNNGKTIDMGKKSLLRIGLKTALIPIAIPMLKQLYKSRGYSMPEHKKHSDLIDYIAFCLLDFITLIEKDVNLYAISIPLDKSSDRCIKTLSTIKQQQLNPPTRDIDEEQK